MPLSEKARIEVYLPDLPKPAYQNLFMALEQEFTYAFGGCTVVRGLNGSYLSRLGQRVQDRVNVIYTDAPFSFEENTPKGFRDTPMSCKEPALPPLKKKLFWWLLSRFITPNKITGFQHPRLDRNRQPSYRRSPDEGDSLHFSAKWARERKQRKAKPWRYSQGMKQRRPSSLPLSDHWGERDGRWACSWSCSFSPGGFTVG